ncbi:hypothetical protein ACIBUY_24755 [Streptomyces sp. NPDC050085]|uniref:hypothetical protein n=1 Tax=Streptomyces sp. NPDC050085 TaxID=3365600 RepID=UPI003790569B
MTTSTVDRVRAAVRDNARWCAVMSQVHGVRGEFGPDAWTASRRTPLYYPDAVTLVPRVDAASLVARIDTRAPGATVKDAFADLDLTEHGFTVLFDAQWIHRDADAPVPAHGLGWDVVKDPDALREWAAAWSGGDDDAADLFGAALLDVPEVTVLAVRDAGGRVVAGAVATSGEDVVGVSNVFAVSTAFAAHDGQDRVWSAVLDATRTLFPGRSLVGYEHDDALTAALRYGFEAVGPLRVWLHA